jgi:hypothetical protein
LKLYRLHDHPLPQANARLTSSLRLLGGLGNISNAVSRGWGFDLLRRRGRPLASTPGRLVDYPPTAKTRLTSAPLKKVAKLLWARLITPECPNTALTTPASASRKRLLPHLPSTTTRLFVAALNSFESCAPLFICLLPSDLFPPFLPRCTVPSCDLSSNRSPMNFASPMSTRRRPPLIPRQARVARGIHGLPKVSSGPAMPNPSTPCWRATPETALRLFRGWPAHRAGGLRPSSTLFDTRRRTGLSLAAADRTSCLCSSPSPSLRDFNPFALFAHTHWDCPPVEHLPCRAEHV